MVMYPTIRWLVVAAALVSPTVLVAPATASLYARSHVRAYEDSTRYSYIEENQDTTQAAVGNAVSDDLPYVVANASALARWGGQLRARTSAEGVYPGETRYRSISNADAELRESIVITSPSVPNGTSGVAQATMHYTGALTTSHTGLSSSSIMFGDLDGDLDVTIANATREIRHQQEFILQGASVSSNYVTEQFDGGDVNTVTESNGTTPVSYGFNETLTFDFDFIFGSPFTFDASLSFVSNAQVFGVGDELNSIGNAGNSANWQGFNFVRTETGSPVTDFDAFGQTSGVNYTHSIPEPATITLLAAALFCLPRSPRKPQIP